MATLSEKKAKILSILESDRAVSKGLVAIYQRQTTDEQSSETTVHANGRGFSGADAEFGSSLAKKVLKGWRLSPEQVHYGRRMLGHYWKQLIEVADKRNPGWADSATDQPATPPTPQPTQPTPQASHQNHKAAQGEFASLGF